jgi:hypothetical protein
MDVELGIVFEAREGATEVAAAPIGFLRDFRGDLLCQLRIVGKDDHARTLVPQRQAAIVICGSGFAGLDVHSTATVSARKASGARASTRSDARFIDLQRRIGLPQ